MRNNLNLGLLSDIQRITQGLLILEKYKPNASVCCASNSTWCIFMQEEEYIGINQEDRDELYRIGWRNPRTTPYVWKCATDRGLSRDTKDPSWFDHRT